MRVVVSPRVLPVERQQHAACGGKTVHIKVIDDEEYEKNKKFFIELMSPRMVDMSLQKGVVLALQTNINVLLSSSLPSPPSSSSDVSLSHSNCSALNTAVRTHCVTWKTVRVKIVDEEEYERQENFFIALGEPKWMERGISALLLTQEVAERKLTVEEEEAKRIAEMGKPILGEHPKLEVIIEESYEFKSTVDKLIKKTNLALVVGTHSWRDQFMEAITVSAAGDEDEDESGEERLPSCFDYVMHFLTVFWKVLFACVPPTEYCNGWACFVVSILIIGMLTAVIGDLASHFGCTIGLKDSVTAVVFVAFGTSVPDTFASKAAAIQDVYADASISNVTGSNAVNVFLGIGLAWSVAAIYWASQGQEFQVSAGTLAFSVTLFTIFAFICISVLLYRRRPHLGGELGGPRGCKLATTLLFVSLWLLYILFATLEAYCYIKGF
ncbi:PREDICTED: sodium/calcium exchanger 3-like [Leptosomus discolor]|uniref:sodium/calcium exchanger 3-like n=1 Tax=Leptosomus discolor TaxID=188344 RepID=UPI0005223A33|nr:PREDICTED: sodium/calcium exchanger 3-like [Leptosomus discolor]